MNTDIKYPRTEGMALVKVMAIGTANTFYSFIECSTDLPAAALGEVAAEALQKLWVAGEDPVKCTLVVQFS